MAPDLNSLPPSRSPLGSPELLRRSTPSPSPRSSSVSLAAAATINAGIQSQDSRRSSLSTRLPPQTSRNERRRSSVMMNLNFNDPSLPGPGELQGNDHRASIGHAFQTTSPQSIGGSATISTGDPHHQRAPSLGEIHQEIEQEQEAQVNRLLQMIRQQQAQLQQIQQAGFTPGTSTGAVDDSTPTSERSFSFPSVPPTMPMSFAYPRPRSPARTSHELSRQSSRRSRTSSRTNSPAIRPLSAGLQAHGDDWLLSGGGGGQGSRDESAFFQAETQTLTRENQMLRMRIRELERQVSELNSAPANTPAVPSSLTGPAMDADRIAAAQGGQHSEEENKT